MTIRQVNEWRKCHRLAVFAILAAMLYVFYILIVVQIALGLYSLWDGFEWFRMVRRRLGSHAGFYAPLAAVICPCKGVEPGLKENLSALAQFDYPNYEIYFSIGNERDPAVKIAEEVKDASCEARSYRVCGPSGRLQRQSAESEEGRGVAAGEYRGAGFRGFGRAPFARLAGKTDCAAARHPLGRDYGVPMDHPEPFNRLRRIFERAGIGLERRDCDLARAAARKFLLGRRHRDPAEDFRGRKGPRSMEGRGQRRS